MGWFSTMLRVLLTNELAWLGIDDPRDRESMGGMAKAIETGSS